MTGNYLILFILIAAGLFHPTLSDAMLPDKPQHLSIGLGAEFTSGSYGTGTETRSMYLPLTVTWSPNERIDLGVEIPFLYQNNANVTTNLFQSSQQTVAADTAAAKGGPGGPGGVPQGGVSSGSTDSAVSGLGDVILRFGVVVLAEGRTAPQIRPSMSIKCPTARKADGLGTGEFDVTAGVDLSKWLGDLHLTGEGSYTYQGKAEGFGLMNYFSYSGGIGYQLTERFEPGLMVKGGTPPAESATALLEVRARTVVTFDDRTSLDLYLSHGLTDSSPEYGGGIAVIYSF